MNSCEGNSEMYLRRVVNETSNEKNVLITKNVVTDLLKALLGNGPVNTFEHTPHATIRWKCFLCVRARTVVMQRASHNSG
jgi:hypothetical protein